MAYQDSSSDINDQPTSPSSSSSLGLLDTFPSEIRDKIYALVFFAGDISLTRASRALHEDTKDALLRHGIYRLNIQYWSDPEVYCWTVACEVSTRLLADVQNLRINVDLGTRFEAHQTQYMPFENLEDDEIACYHQALWTLKSDSSASLLPDPNAVDFQNYGLWTMWSRSLKLILQRLTGTMKRHSYCEIIYLDSSPRGVLSTAYDALELFRSFKTVSVQYTYGPLHSYAEMLIHLRNTSNIRNNHERTIKALGHWQGLEKGPDLTITQRANYINGSGTLKFWGDEPYDNDYYINGSGTLKFWGDAPVDKDYGLGEWTAKTGRIWPIRNP